MASSSARSTSSGVRRICTPCLLASSSAAWLSWSTVYALSRVISAMVAYFTMACRSGGSSAHFFRLTISS